MRHLDWKRFSLLTWIIHGLANHSSPHHIHWYANSPWAQISSIGAFLVKPLGAVTSFPSHLGLVPRLHHLQIHPLLGFLLHNPPRSTPSRIYNSAPWTNTFNRLGHSRTILPHPLHLWHWMPLGNLVGSLLHSSLGGCIKVLTTTLWFLLIRLLEILILVLTRRCLSFFLVLSSKNLKMKYPYT